MRNIATLLLIGLIAYTTSEGIRSECAWKTWCSTAACGGNNHCDGISNSIPCRLKNNDKLRVVVEINDGKTPHFMSYCITLDKVSQLIVNGCTF